VDIYQQSVGVRTVAVDGIRFRINCEPVYFTGFGMHEDHAVLGKLTARSPSACRRTWR
jgi:beta-glucuronidase